MSSSAALEVASLMAIVRCFNLDVDGVKAALCAQRVENLIVGAPCGIMDQMASLVGKRGACLHCGAIPRHFWEHWSCRLRWQCGVSTAASATASAVVVTTRLFAALHSWAKRFSESPTSKYLTDMSPSDIDAESLPPRLVGSDYLAKFPNGTDDQLSQVVPEREYAVRAATVHPIHEHHRVQLFAALLGSDDAKPSLVSADTSVRLLGELMLQSHASYSACGLGSEGTDALVDLVKSSSVLRGLYGAKISGGGSGGTIVALGHPSAKSEIKAIAQTYASKFGHSPYVFSGSSLGARQFGHVSLKF